MFVYFIGGGFGSLLGALAWHWANWWGVCGVGAAAVTLALMVEFVHGREVVPKS